MTHIDVSITPRKQSILLGHSESMAKMRSAFEQQSLNPVWMLCGNRGIGKATFAYNIARYIFKKSMPGEIVDLQVSEGSYPNLLTIERKANEDGKLARDIPVDDARRVVNFLKKTAAMPGARIVIIDSIDEMNRSAANSLLKIIEEPPKDTYIFMICHALGQVLPTIKSRAMRLDLKPLEREDLEPLVIDQFKNIVPKLAEGSIGKAMRLLEIDPIKLTSNLYQSFKQAACGKISSLDNLISNVSKNETAYGIALDLIPNLISRVVLSGAARHKTSPLIEDEQSIIEDLLKHQPLPFWIKAWHGISSFLQYSRISNLDKSHSLWAIYCIIEQPELGATFVKANREGN